LKIIIKKDLLRYFAFVFKDNCNDILRKFFKLDVKIIINGLIFLKKGVISDDSK